ncbi:MAG: membrane protein insertion efficiency factor YidD [Methylotenera sp.]|nr:MAG: membrane protein insertion efficiency factor YidD [Methylotenera sp.]
MSLSRILIGLIKGYQYLLSPLIGQQCRFYPTCSQYALEAIEKHGAIKGGYYMTHRLMRCHPWCAGGHDPIP